MDSRGTRPAASASSPRARAARIHRAARNACIAARSHRLDGLVDALRAERANGSISLQLPGSAVRPFATCPDAMDAETIARLTRNGGGLSRRTNFGREGVGTRGARGGRA